MVDMQDLETILSTRSVPAPRSNLEERIIAMAVNRPQMKEQGLFSELRGLLAGFWDGLLLPAPVLSLSLVLLVGLYVGLNTQTSVTADAGDVDMYTYFQMADNADYGDWI